LAWPGSWLSSSSIRRRRNFAAGGFLGLLGLLGLFVLLVLLEPAG
jgi:hypothetical protein